MTTEIFEHEILIASKWLKLQTSNLTDMFLETVRASPLKSFYFTVL